MGAEFRTMTVPGSKSKVEVEEAFGLMQNEHAYEFGHSYSGGFNMTSGLRFYSENFPDECSAEEWLSKNAVKHGPALAVRTPESWVIGASCAC